MQKRMHAANARAKELTGQLHMARAIREDALAALLDLWQHQDAHGRTPSAANHHLHDAKPSLFW